MKEILISHWVTYLYLAFLAVVVFASIWTGNRRGGTVRPNRRARPERRNATGVATAITADVAFSERRTPVVEVHRRRNSAAEHITV